MKDWKYGRQFSTMEHRRSYAYRWTYEAKGRICFGWLTSATFG